MFLLVGLGNVGYKYTYSRHNVGFLVVDQIVDQFGLNNLGKNFIKSINNILIK